jgi:hypothetical protein
MDSNIFGNVIVIFVEKGFPEKLETIEEIPGPIYLTGDGLEIEGT